MGYSNSRGFRPVGTDSSVAGGVGDVEVDVGDVVGPGAGRGQGSSASIPWTRGSAKKRRMFVGDHWGDDEDSV